MSKITISRMKPHFFITPFAVLLLLICTHITCSVGIVRNETSDRDALVAFKTRLTSRLSHALNTSWSTDASVCNWIGVSCGIRHPRVTALNFSAFGFEGTVAPELGNMTFLRSIDLNHNNFTGSVPHELSNLRRLKVISMANNSLSGEIPLWFGSLGELETVILNNNSFSGSIPASLGNSTKLRILNMGYNNLGGRIPREFGNLSSLETLDLRYNGEIRGSIPESIFNSSRIEEIRLTGNSLSGVLPKAMCSDISKLNQLTLSQNLLSGQVPFDIYKCSELRIISLYSNHFNGSIPSSIGELTKLRWLFLGENGFQGGIPTSFSNLSNLENLNLQDNKLTGSIPSSIFNVSTMQSLSLAFNGFSGELPSTMGFSLPNLQYLYLNNNNLSGAIPSSIANASDLVLIEMSRNSFSGSVPDFGNLQALDCLNIAINNLKGEHPNQEMTFLSSLTKCRLLSRIEISFNQLSGVLPASIGNFSSHLQVFGAYDCGIRGSIPVEIGNLTNLRDLYLSTNELTGFIPTTLGRFNLLTRVYLDNNNLEGGIPTNICQLSMLGEFIVSENRLNGPIPTCIGGLKSLRTLYLDSNMLESQVPSNLWSLNDLLLLNLSSNILSGSLPSEIGNLKHIVELDLSSNNFSGDIPSSIDGAQTLANLSLARNKFQGSVPQSIGNLTVLESLDLSFNNFSGSLPKSLEGLLFLRYFNVSYNRLEGPIPTGGQFANFTAQSFMENNGLCGAVRLQVPPCEDIHKKSKNVASLMKYILPPFLSVVIVAIVILVLMKRKKSRPQPTSSEISLLPSWRASSYLELQRATNAFSESNLLGSGSFGSVYIGTLFDGLTVAVKVFSLLSERVTRSFDTEMEVLKAIRHRNLIKIIGCCISADFKALVYEYMPNGNLEKWLYGKKWHLDLVQRLNIAIDVALALEYLHIGLTPLIVHCDLKPSNILLDGEMTARVGDFGIAKIVGEEELMSQTKTLATIGYMAPEYGSEGIVSTSADVYSFGIILLEICTGKNPTDEMFGDELSLKKWVSLSLDENAMMKVVDNNLFGEDDQNFSAKEQCLSSILRLAMECVAFSPSERIKMSEAVAKLKNIKNMFPTNCKNLIAENKV